MLDQKHRKSFEDRLHIKILSVSESHGKSGSQTYIINDLFVLKIYLKENKRTYKSLFFILEKNKIPCQVFIDEWSDSYGKYLVLKKTNGLPISKLVNRNKYYPQLGKVLKQIHQISMEGYGPINLSKGFFLTWHEFLNQFNKYELNHSKIVPSLVSNENYILIKQLLNDVAKIPFKSGLVHGDFTENNIIVDNDNIVAIIDWDTGIIGDPVMDFSVLDIVGPYVINKELLYEYYLDESLSKKGNFEYRRDVYFLFSAFVTLNNFYNVNRDDINLLPLKIKEVCKKYS